MSITTAVSSAVLHLTQPIEYVAATATTTATNGLVLSGVVLFVTTAVAVIFAIRGNKNKTSKFFDEQRLFEVSSLVIYPIKSCKGIQVKEALVTARGFQWDRMFMLVDENGKFISQRSYPRMALISAELDKEKGELIVTAPGMSTLHVPLTYSPEAPVLRVSVWSDDCTAVEVTEATTTSAGSPTDKTTPPTTGATTTATTTASTPADTFTTASQWFRHFLQLPADAADGCCRLVRMHEDSIRRTDPDYDPPLSTQHRHHYRHSSSAGNSNSNLRGGEYTATTGTAIATTCGGDTVIEAAAEEVAAAVVGSSGVSQTSLSDGFPFLLAGDASLDELNRQLLLQKQQPVGMERFRPNITVRGSAAFAEDRWGRIRFYSSTTADTAIATATAAAGPATATPNAMNSSTTTTTPITTTITTTTATPITTTATATTIATTVSSIDMWVVKPCSRCTIPNVDPDTGIPDGERQPSKAMKRFRSGAAVGLTKSKWAKELFFGQNLQHAGQQGAVIKVGDTIEVCSFDDKFFR